MVSLANGVLLAYLLLAPRWNWKAFLCAGFAAQVLGGALVAGNFHLTNLPPAILNLSEVLGAAVMLRRRSTGLPCFTDIKYLLRFIGFGCIAAPLATGSVYALMSIREGHIAPLQALLSWTAAHGLGIAVATPAFVAIFRVRRWNGAASRTDWIILALLVLVVIAEFFKWSLPLLILIDPLLVLILLRLGLGWSTVGLLAFTVAAGLQAVRWVGPFAVLASFSSIQPLVMLQLFVARGMLILYGVAAVMDRYKVSERQLKKIASLHSLVSKHSRDAIIMADLSGHRRYGSSAAQSIEGWKPEELMTEKGLELVHPEDRSRVRAVLSELQSSAEGAVIECRVRKRAGDYIWVEASLRMIRDPETGVPSGILNFVRDISVRKCAELKLQDAYDAVEALSVTDPLTGLANRRRFDKYLASEWRRAMRSLEPLSLLMIDADNFKKYNDTYGHPRGDNCLKQIAEAASDSVGRAADLVARFGGEEFVIVLPNTDNAGAMHVANLACEAIRGRALPHAGNPPGIVTLSVGCATMIPMSGHKVSDLIDMADAAVYKAKQNGRNQVFNACAADHSTGDGPEQLGQDLVEDLAGVHSALTNL
jgi:diguanylate cyclase (GGDEF)-like protein/PAS domain S-box-containing protein